MKITRTESPLIPASRTSEKSPLSPAPSPSRPASTPDLSQEVKGMAKAIQLLATSSDVDMKKVEQIRTAIAEGRLELDLDALSQAIVELHRT